MHMSSTGNAEADLGAGGPRSDSRGLHFSTQTRSLFQLKDAFHGQPFLTRLGVGESLLELPHEGFPLLDFGIRTVGAGFGSEGEAVVHVHDHEQASAAEIDLHVFDAGVADALGDFRTRFFCDSGGIRR